MRPGIVIAVVKSAAHCADDPIALEHRAVVDLLPPMAIERGRDDLLAAHERNW
jgi:hypothetical protein